MRIAVIGTGRVGRVLGRRWAGQGHEVTFGSRDPAREQMQALAAAAGARIESQRQAAQGAEVVVLAIPWGAALETVENLGALDGKIVVDCTNPLGPSFTLLGSVGDSAAERIAARTGGAPVVKCFSTTGTENMDDPVIDGQRLAMFLCGDDEAAKQIVAALAEALGFEAVDAGPLRHAHHLEALAVLWIHMAYAGGRGRDYGLALVSRS